MSKKVTVKKLYKGMADVRDYDVNKCIDENTPLMVQYGVDVMTLSPEQLKSDMKSISSKTFESKVGGKNYKLCSYDFVPDPVEL